MKARKISMFLVAMMLTLIVSASASAETVSYVFNGDFEITADNDSGVDAWGNFTGIRDLVEVTDDSHSGSYALKISQWDSEIYIAQFDAWVKDKVTAYDPTKDALLSVWVKYEGLTDEGIMLLAERKYNSGADNAFVQSEPGAYVGSSNGWVKLELPVPAMGQKDMTEVGVGIKVLAGEGVVYIDDISFVPVDAKAADTSESTSTTTTSPSKDDTTDNASVDTTDDAAVDTPKTGENNLALGVSIIGLVVTAFGMIVISKRRKALQ